jgi:hypothetical protein
MVSPTSFAFNEQTAPSNSFQQRTAEHVDEVRRRARNEFDRFVEKLGRHGVFVTAVEDDPIPAKPDAVFPNNWLSTWPDGRVYLYPMATQSRRLERRSEILDELRQHFEVAEVIDLSGNEQAGAYLEGTGAMVFDHANGLAYACVSPRCDEALLRRHVAELGYQPIVFHAYDQLGKPVYHTNVVMDVQTVTAVVCSEAILDPQERTTVVTRLRKDHAVVEITMAQMNSFCANVLELRDALGKRFLVASESAAGGFSDEQLRILTEDTQLLAVDIATIETIGGGSARCMLAEIFLPRKPGPARPGSADGRRSQ